MSEASNTEDNRQSTTPPTIQVRLGNRWWDEVGDPARHPDDIPGTEVRSTKTITVVSMTQDQWLEAKAQARFHVWLFLSTGADAPTEGGSAWLGHAPNALWWHSTKPHPLNGNSLSQSRDLSRRPNQRVPLVDLADLANKNQRWRSGTDIHRRPAPRPLPQTDQHTATTQRQDHLHNHPKRRNSLISNP